MASGGRLLLTVPSPFHQKALTARGESLQVVDEVVSIEDLLKLASDIGGRLTYFQMISVWCVNDYIHAMIERDAGRYGSLTESEKLPIKGWLRGTLVDRVWTWVIKLSRWNAWCRLARRWRVRMRLPRDR